MTKPRRTVHKLSYDDRVMICRMIEKYIRDEDSLIPIDDHAIAQRISAVNGLKIGKELVRYYRAVILGYPNHYARRVQPEPYKVGSVRRQPRKPYGGGVC